MEQHVRFDVQGGVLQFRVVFATEHGCQDSVEVFVPFHGAAPLDMLLSRRESFCGPEARCLCARTVLSNDVLNHSMELDGHISLTVCREQTTRNRSEELV